MFWALNGTTSTPWRANHRHSAVTSQLFPAPDVHPSTISALRAYAGLRDAHFPTPSTSAFFPSARGRRMGREELNATFTKLVGQIGLEGCGARARPRPHDYADLRIMPMWRTSVLVTALPRLEMSA